MSAQRVSSWKPFCQVSPFGRIHALGVNGVYFRFNGRSSEDLSSCCISPSHQQLFWDTMIGSKVMKSYAWDPSLSQQFWRGPALHRHMHNLICLMMNVMERWLMHRSMYYAKDESACQNHSLIHCLTIFFSDNELVFKCKWISDFSEMTKDYFCLKKKKSQGAGFPVSFFPAHKGNCRRSLQKGSVLREATWRGWQVSPQELWCGWNRGSGILLVLLHWYELFSFWKFYPWTFPHVTRAFYGWSHAFTYLLV